MSTPPFSTVWQPDTPATVQENLNISAPKINGNWNTIAYWGAQDHNPLGQTTNIGQHLQSTYVTQSAVPSADLNNIRLFSQLVEILSTPPVSIPQIFAQYPTGSPVQLTQQVAPTTYKSGAQIQTEVSFTIGGIILKLGVLTSWPSGQSIISFGANNEAVSPAPPASTPFPTSLFFCPVFAIPPTSATNFSFFNGTPAGFTLNTTSFLGSFFYIAAGN